MITISDGSISIKIEVDGKKVEHASKEIDKLGNAAKGAGQDTGDAEDKVKKYGDATEKAGSKTKKFVAALGLITLGAAAFNVLRKSLDTAIARFDTLNNFPRVLEQMGHSAEDSQRAMDNLSDGIDGLPTKLDEVVSTTQEFAIMTKDLDGAVDTTLALNNAFLASGSSSANAARGLEQYTQMFAKNEVDLQSWRTLQETMGLALDKVAESFKMTGESAQNDLYEALKSGDITFKQFNERIIELNDGVGGFAEMAKTNSTGLATSFSNLRNAAARGIADILKSFNKLSEDVTGRGLAENIDKLKHIINAAFKVIGQVIEKTAPIVVALADGLKGLLNVAKPLAPVIVALASAYASWVIIQKINGFLKAQNDLIKTATTVNGLFTIATAAQTKALLTNEAAKKAGVAATLAQNGALKLSTVIVGLLTGQIKLSTVAALAKAAALGVLRKAFTIMTGPIGIAAAAIGLLAGAVVGIVKWFKRTTEEGERLAKEVNKLGEATDDLTSDIEGNMSAYDKQQKKIESNAKANDDLINKIETLSEKENKSAADKRQLAEYVDLLNQSMGDLNLAYGEESDMLNMSTEQLRARAELHQEEEKYTAAVERQNEIFQELTDTQEHLNLVAEKREELEKNSTITNGERREEVEKLDAQEQKLKETMEQLGAQWQITDQQVIDSSKEVDRILAENIDNQLILFDKLSDSHKETVGEMQATWQSYVDKATDMFDTLSDKTDMTISDLSGNMEENQRVISEWADNIAILAERGVDEGLLNQLRDAGPQSAGYVKAIVEGSDDELKKLNDVFREGAKVGTDGFIKGLDLSESEVMDKLGMFITNANKTLSDKIKAANFSELGQEVSESTAGGIEEGTASAVKASADMAEKIEKEAKNVLEINSPSKVFTKIGENIPEGMEIGINNGIKWVFMAARKLALDMLTPFKNQPSQFRSIGANAMSGMNAGLNAGAGRVMATARNIANSVARTMKNALRIHSPSRVTMGIGEDVGEGLTIGMESMLQSIRKQASKMAIASIPGSKSMLASPRIESSNKTRENAEKIMKIFNKLKGGL